MEKKAQPEPQSRAKESGVKAPLESPRNAGGMEKQAPRVSEQPAQQKPAPTEKGAGQPDKKDGKQEGN